MKAAGAALNDRLLKALECAQLHSVAPTIALEILSTYDDRVASVSLEKQASIPTRPAEIDGLYREIRELQGKVARDPSLEEAIQEKLSRLRQLQSEEATELRRRFKARLPFASGSGRQLVEKARRLLGDHPST